jgi:cysteine desulfurase
MNTIYLDYQASTPTDPAVIDVITASLRQSFANPSAEAHSLGWEAAAALEAARATLARVLRASSDEIIFTSGATEADNIALLGAARAEQRDVVGLSCS